MMKQLNCLNKRKLELGKWKVAGARFLYGVMFADFFFRIRYLKFFFSPESVQKSRVEGALNAK